MGNNVIKTHLRIVNNTDTDIVTTSVSNYDNFDWAGNVRVNKNFQNAYIPAGGFKEETENINGNASRNPFNMTLKFKDGTTDAFRINMKYAACGSNSMFNHYTKCHDISPRRSAHNTLIITIDNTHAQKENILAERRNKEGEALLNQQKYKEALDKFEEAKNKANQNATIAKVNRNKSLASEGLEKKKINDKAIKLNNDALVLMREKNYKLAMEKFEEALKFANLNTTISLIQENKKSTIKKQNDAKAADLNQKGEEEMKKGNYLEAMKIFEEASGLTSNHWITRSLKQNLENSRESYVKKISAEAEELMKMKKFEEAITKFKEAKIDSIKINKSDAYNRYGKELFEEGVTLERDTTNARSEDASEKFRQAEEKFGISVNLNRTDENENNLKNTKIKIAGNKIFNEAIELELDASKLFDNKDYNKAEETWENALEKYKEAKKKFEEGSMFSGDVQLVVEQISDLEEVISDAKIVELSHDISKVHVEQKTKNDDDETKQEEGIESELVISGAPN